MLRDPKNMATFQSSKLNKRESVIILVYKKTWFANVEIKVSMMTRYVLLFLLIFECVFASPLWSAETVKIASIFAFTGIAAPANQASILGVRYGIEEVNRRGGILGRQIELIELDNRSTPIGSKVAAEQAVKKNVVAIIGASWSSHSIAVAKVAQAAGLPMISTASTNEKVTRVGDFIFRACYTDPYQGRLMANFAVTQLQAKTASILFDVSSDYSFGLAKVFAENFKKHGGRIDKVVPYKFKQDNYRTEIEELKQIDSDILFVPGHDESAKILLEAAEAGIKSIPVGCDGWSTAKSFKKGEIKVALAYYSSHWSEGVQSPSSQEFVTAYKEEGRSLSIEPLGYDAALLMADAITRADSFKPEQIKTALQRTKNFQGVTGNISFDEFGDPLKTMVIIRIHNGESHYLTSIPPEQLEMSAPQILEVEK
jgi:branched-chain amino acid transport system substrate-binding protein